MINENSFSNRCRKKARNVWEPWIVYGQTQTAAGTNIDNPAANSNGLRGESSLPYTVPIGKELVVEAYGIEGYPNPTGGVALIPFIGNAPSKQTDLFTCYANTSTNEVTGIRYYIPAGLTFNIRITQNESPGPVTAWYVRGKLYNC